MVSQVLTANRLIDGDVVYWRAGAWVEALAEAEAFPGDAEAKAAVEAAKRFVAGNVVVNPYLFELKGGRPAKEREIFQVPDFIAKMIERKQFGDKTKGGFYKKEKGEEGKKMWVIEPKTGEYRESQKAKFESVGKVKGIEDPGKRCAELTKLL